MADTYFPDTDNNVWGLMVQDGKKGAGEFYMPSSDQSFGLRSGTNGLWDTAQGDYLIGKREGPSNGAMKIGKTGFKYELLAVTEEGAISSIQVKDKESGEMTQGVWDPRKGDWRTFQRLHPDGNVPGTAGCAGITNEADAIALDNILKGKQYDSMLMIRYFKNQQELDDFKKKLKEIYGKKQDPISKTNNDAALRNGDGSVYAGPQQRKIAFAQGACIHEGGAPVANGSCSVYVSPKQYPVARVKDVHTDGQVIKTGTNAEVLVG